MLQYIEYGYYDFDSNAKETKTAVEKAIKYSPSTLIPAAKKIIV